MLLLSSVSHLVFLNESHADNMEVLVCLQPSKHEQWTWAMLSMTFCAYSAVVMEIFLDGNTTTGCVTVTGFLLSICHTAFYFPLVMLHLYLQLGTIFMFIFVSYQLYFETGYAVAKILLTTQYFLCLQCHLCHICVAMIWLIRHRRLQWQLRVWVALAI